MDSNTYRRSIGRGSPGTKLVLLCCLVILLLTTAISCSGEETNKESNSAWKIIGPGGGGALYYPTISPFDPNIVLAACDMSDSFITLDAGKSWSELNFGSNTRAFAHDPLKAGVMYAGSSTGLYRTQNGGRDWQLIFPDPAAVIGRSFVGDHAEQIIETSDNWPGGQVTAIAVDPADSRNIYIGIRGNGLGIYRSSDGGKSWEAAGLMQDSDLLRLYVAGPRDIIAVSGDEICRFHGAQWQMDTLMLPGGRAIQDVSQGEDITSGATVFYAATGSWWNGSKFHSGLYRSADCANSWTELSGGLDQDVSAGEERVINRVAACYSNADIVYASIKEPYESNTHYFGILKSEDGGNSWHWALRMDENQPANRTTGWVERDYDTSWGGAPFWMGVAPNNPGICYATDWGTVYKTTDGGGTWQQLYTREQPDGSWSSRGIDVTNVYDLAFDPFDSRHMLLPCTDIGLFASHDGGAGWKHAEIGVPGPWSNTCYSAVFDPGVKGRVWSAWANCHDLPRQKMMRNGNLDSYVGGVCKSEDDGDTWQVSSSGMPAGCLVTHLVLDPESKAGMRTLYAAAFGKGVYKSTDDGNSWVEMNNGIEGNMNAWRLCLLPGGRLYLLMAGNIKNGQALDGALYCSDDGAAHWRRLPVPEGIYFPNDIDYDPLNPARIYLACWGNENGQPARCGGLYVSGDGGDSWAGLMDSSLHVYGVTVSRADPKIIYATAYEGIVYRTVNGGNTWKALEGCDFKWPKKVIADPVDNRMIYITTFGSCAWHGPAAGNPREFGIVRID